MSNGNRMARLSLLAIGFIIALISCEDPYTTELYQAVEAAVEADRGGEEPVGPVLSVSFEDDPYASGGTLPSFFALPGGEVLIIVTFANAGDQDLILGGAVALELHNTSGTAFAVHQQPAASLRPGEETTVRLSFAPESPGEFGAQIVLTTNDANIPTYTLDLTGRSENRVLVDTPVAGAAFAPGGDLTIGWTAIDPTSTVSITLLKDGSANTVIAAATEDDGSFTWSVPGGQSPGTDYSVLVEPTENAELGGTGADFSIGTITDVDPNGGEIFKPGANPTVTWSSAIGGTVSIQLWESGSLYATIATGVDNSGTYTGWTVPDLDGDEYEIRVLSEANASIFDESDAFFAIGDIDSVAPTGGAFYPGSLTHITWNSAIGGNVRIELMKDGVVYGSAISLSDPNDGMYVNWTVPAAASGTGFKIRVTSVENPSIVSESASSFSIGSVQVTAPNGGGGFEQGQSTTISWSSDLGGTFRIELLRGGVPQQTIASSVGGSSYSWTVGVSQTPAVDYRVRVLSNLNASIRDDSNANFTVRGWYNYGEQAGTSNGATPIGLAIMPDGSPVVSYIDGSDNAIVRHWNGSGWNTIGGGPANDLAVFRDDENNVFRSLTIAARPPELGINGYIWVAYTAASDYLPRVKYATTSGSWNDAGPAHNVGGFCLSTAVDGLGYSYLGFSQGDAGAFYYPRTKRYNRSTSTWEDRSNAAAERVYAGPLVIDNYDPVHGFVPHDNTSVYGMEVRRNTSGTSWTDMGSPSGGGSAFYSSLATPLDPGSVYASYMELSGVSPELGGSIRVKRHSTGTTWTDLGTPGFGRWNNLITDTADDKPFIVFTDLNDGWRARIMKYDSGTTWTDLGSYGFTVNSVSVDVQIGVDPNDNMPIIAFYDVSLSDVTIRVVKRVY